MLVFPFPFILEKNQISIKECSDPSIIYYAVLIQDQILNFLASYVALPTFLVFRCYASCVSISAWVIK